MATRARDGRGKALKPARGSKELRRTSSGASDARLTASYDQVYAAASAIQSEVSGEPGPAPAGPRRLSWGTSRGSSLAPTRQSSLAFTAAPDAPASILPPIDGSPRTLPPLACVPEADELGAALAVQLQGGYAPQPSRAVLEEAARRAALRAVLVELLGVQGPMVDHYVLSPETVAAVAAERQQQAVQAATEQARAAAAAATRQQVAEVVSAEEKRAADALAAAQAEAAAAAAQLQADLAKARKELEALAKEKKQLFGRAAQQERDVKEAAAAQSGTRALAAELQQQVDKYRRMAEAREAALTRLRLDQHHALAEVQSALQAERELAEGERTSHAAQVKQLRAKHAAELSNQAAAAEARRSEQLAAARQQAVEQMQQVQQAGRQLVASVRSELDQLQQEQRGLAAHAAQQLHGLAQQIYAAQGEAADALAALHEQVAEGAADLLRLATAAGTKQQEAAGKAVQMALAISRLGCGDLSGVKQALDDARERAERAAEQAAVLQEQLDAAQSAVQQLEQQRSAAAHELQAARQQAEDLSKEAGAAAEETARLRASLEEQQGQEAALEQQLQEASEAGEQLKVKLAAADKQLVAAGKAAAERAAALRQAEADAAQLRLRHEQDLADATAALTARIRKLRGSYFHVSNPAATGAAAQSPQALAVAAFCATGGARPPTHVCKLDASGLQAACISHQKRKGRLVRSSDGAEAGGAATAAARGLSSELLQLEGALLGSLVGCAALTDHSQQLAAESEAARQHVGALEQQVQQLGGWEYGADAAPGGWARQLGGASPPTLGGQLAAVHEGHESDISDDSSDELEEPLAGWRSRGEGQRGSGVAALRRATYSEGMPAPGAGKQPGPLQRSASSRVDAAASSARGGRSPVRRQSEGGGGTPWRRLSEHVSSSRGVPAGVQRPTAAPASLYVSAAEAASQPDRRRQQPEPREAPARPAGQPAAPSAARGPSPELVTLSAEASGQAAGAGAGSVDDEVAELLGLLQSDYAQSLAALKALAGG